MEWITPKTNWTEDDYINVSDYNRIRNNIIYLAQDEILPAYIYFGSYSPEIIAPMLNSYVIDYSTYDNIYASWNAIENMLNWMSLGCNLPEDDIFEKKVFKEFDNYIDYEELNRIENMTLYFYNLYLKMKEVGKKLPMELGHEGDIRL